MWCVYLCIGCALLYSNSAITLSICTISFVECVLTMVLTLIHFVILAGMHGSPSPVVL